MAWSIGSCEASVNDAEWEAWEQAEWPVYERSLRLTRAAHLCDLAVEAKGFLADWLTKLEETRQATERAHVYLVTCCERAERAGRDVGYHS